MIPRPPKSTLFPDATLFRSRVRAGLHVWAVLVAGCAGLVGGLLAAVTGVLPPWAAAVLGLAVVAFVLEDTLRRDRKSTRLNSSHANISYAVFCLKQKQLTLI